MRLIILLLLFALTASGQVRQKVVDAYLSEIGVRELSGRNDGVQVEKYLLTVNLGKGYAWCAAFVNYCLEQAHSTRARSAWSPDWFPKQRLIYSNGQTRAPPQPGDVFGIYFSDKKRIAHVGFIHQWGTKTVITVEGNTNTAGSREGDGVYRKVRLTKQIYAVANWIDN